MSAFRLIGDDVAAACASLPETSFDAVLCDSPYHLTQKSRGGSTQPGDNRTTPFGRAGVGTDKGFMEQTWDGGDVAFRPETWTAIRRVMKPGAYLMAFGSPRTWHRLAVALEDAGLEVVDTLMWIYGQGLPKSRNMGQSDAGWAGYGTALKPAWEPVILARQPLAMTYAANVLTWGCGALNIDGGRILAPEGMGSASSSGRFPANLLLDEESADALDAQTGILKSGAMAAGTPRTVGNKGVYHTIKTVATSEDIQANAGGASRFFYVGKVKTGEREAGMPKGFANNHPTLKPLALTTYLATLLLPPERATPRRILVPFSGAGSEMIGALQAGWETVVGIEREEFYIPIARARLRHWVPGSTEERDYTEEGSPCPETG